MKNNNHNTFFKYLSVLAVIIVVVALYFILVLWPQPKERKFLDSNKSKINNTSQKLKPNIGGEFELIDSNGDKFFSQSLQGKPYLIYFGFTFCPDICPASLSKISEVIDTLDKYHIDITSVFVSVDPKRDTPSALKNYMKNFNHKIIALTGSESQVKDITTKFKVYYAVSNLGNKPVEDNYTIDHSVYIYLMDKNGKYEKHFDLDSTSEEIVEYIRIHNGNPRR